MAELEKFLQENEGRSIALVTSSGIFNGKIVSSSVKNVELSDVAEGFSGIGQHMKSLIILLDSITAWGVAN
jgi:hypothetical protein